MASGEYERGYQQGKLFAMRAHHRYLNDEITREDYYAETNAEIARKRLEVLRSGSSKHAARVYERGYADGILGYRRDMEGK